MAPAFAAQAWIEAAARQRAATSASDDAGELANRLEASLAALPPSVAKAAALLRCSLADFAADGLTEDDSRGLILATLALEALEALTDQAFIRS